MRGLQHCTELALELVYSPLFLHTHVIRLPQDPKCSPTPAMLTAVDALIDGLDLMNAVSFLLRYILAAQSVTDLHPTRVMQLNSYHRL